MEGKPVKKASLMQVLTFGQVSDLVREMGQYITPEEAYLLLRHREAWGAMAVAMRQQHPFNHVRLWHDMYTPTDLIRNATFKRLREAASVDPEKLRWVGPQEPPAFTDDPEVSIVLSVTLRTLEETVFFLWSWALAQNYASTNVLHLSTFDASRLRYIGSSQIFVRPNTLRWMKLRTYGIDSSAQFAGPEVLALAAQHPGWIRHERDVNTKIRMGGLEAYDLGRREWGWNPALSYNSSRNSLTLQAWAKDENGHDVISPVIIA